METSFLPLRFEWRPCLVFCAAMGFCHPALASQAELDLFAAMAEVDSTHPLVNAKRQEFSAAESGLSAAKQQRFPTLTVQTSRANTVNANTIATARVQQPLFAGGRIDAGIERGEGLIAEVQANLALVRRDLMTRTASTFIEVVKSRARLKVAERNVAEHERLLESINRRVGAEVSPESDLMLTRSRLAQAQSEQIQVALALRRSQDLLSELLSRPAPKVTEPALKATKLAEDLNSAVAQAETFSPEVKIAAAQESIAMSDLDTQRSAVWPALSLRHEQLVGDLDPGLARSQTYVALEFVPGAGLSVASQIRAAESRRLAAIEARRVAEKDARDRVRTLWAEANSLKSQVDSTRNYVRSAQLVSESFSRQFTIGRKSWLEVLNSIREYLLAELNLEELIWNSALANLRLEIETGQLNPDNLSPAKAPDPLAGQPAAGINAKTARGLLKN